ncbi:hypothetical protein [Myroides phaeus]|uniref:SMI1 / KNR4 family (SUKH-1) n=1 Tax=Myroides phaeus TaxID=702745 RepID=A0A1G8DKX0_9FLAO|nr:hypothetical protein [Myroides phaeus]SDH58353.1 hypothetical protein SAMN05421818_10777 [Myroides phaeus]
MLRGNKLYKLFINKQYRNIIADAGADPYCIDINQITDQDAPIYTSMHGTGQWEFELYADSFLSFLKEIAGK